MAVEGANGDLLDLESSLLQQFSCLGTQDKDVLINQFQKLLSPNQLSAEGCAFFLDMNNWNLQQAICSYFDLDCPKELTGWLDSVPSMTLIKDVTIGEGEEVPPNTRFIKTWRIQNSGTVRWPPDCCLRYVDGHLMGHCDRVLVEPLEPGQIVDISIEMVSPDRPGNYQGVWRMSSASGHFFGEPIWVIITVAEGGLLSLTQQMDSFHQLGNHPNHVPNKPNPFEANFRRHLESMSNKQSDQPSELLKNNEHTPNYMSTLNNSGCGGTDRLLQSSSLCETTSETLKASLFSSSSSPSQSWNHSGTTSNTINPCLGVDTSSLEHAANVKEESSSQLNRSNNLPPTPPPSEDMML